MKRPTVRNNNGSCCIRFRTPDGQAHSLTQGRYDDPVAKARMERIALEVYEAVLDGSFDGLERYKLGKDKPTFKAIIEILQLRLIDTPGAWALLKLFKPAAGKPFSTEVIRQLLDKSALSPATQRRYLTEMRRIFPQWAMYFKISVKGKSGKTKEPDRSPFTDDEVFKILNALKDTGIYFNYFYLLLNTGMRPSELLGLQVGHVDLAGGQITIKVSLSRKCTSAKERIPKCTKTGKSRVFPINETLADCLASLANAATLPEDYLCSDTYHAPLDEDKLRYEWRKALKAAGVRYRPPYTCRHTFISHCLKRGIDVATVARWVGNSPEIIWRHYADSIGDEKPPELY